MTRSLARYFLAPPLPYDKQAGYSLKQTIKCAQIISLIMAAGSTDKISLAAFITEQHSRAPALDEAHVRDSYQPI